jgi:hypothetical protein
MSEPIACYTVQFSRPVTGTDLMEALKVVATQKRVRFFAEEIDGTDACNIRLASNRPYEVVDVSPSPEDRGILPGGEYEQVVVMSHSLPENPNLGGHDFGASHRSVRKFAEAIRLYLSGLPAAA